MLVGCNASPPRTATLTPDQARALAQNLANEKAQTLFKCQPFHNGPPAQFVQGHWTWHQLQAQGTGDMEANVEFEADGAKPGVTVLRLESLPQLRDF